MMCIVFCVYGYVVCLCLSDPILHHHLSYTIHHTYSNFRVRLARRKIERVKAEKLAIKQRLAALRLQCAFRSHKARRTYHEKKHKVRRTKASVCIQCAWRVYKARDKFKKKFEHKMALQVCV
ncbi:hypothetical protein EON63_01145 [archaeon]|nr:MAG: hypothetical protein EON63_01145 [archaeon]